MMQPPVRERTRRHNVNRPLSTSRCHVAQYTTTVYKYLSALEIEMRLVRTRIQSQQQPPLVRKNEPFQ